VFSHRTIEIRDPTKDHAFKVNGHKLKHFLEKPSERDVECLFLYDPPSFG